LPGFPEQLVGSGLASELEFSLTFPEDYLQAEMAGKDCNFTVYIEEIKERKMPELDEEFIQSLNMDVQDETGLKDKLQEDIHQQKQMSADRGFEEQVIAKMVECAQMELPPLLVDEEIEHILGDQAEALRRQQLSMDAYLATVGKSVDELREEARPMAVERLTRTLAMQAFREKEGIDVAQNEIEDEIEQMLSQSTVPSDSFRDMLASEDGQTSIKNMLLNRKTIGRLTEIAKGETTEGVQPVNEADPEGNLNQEELERGD
jgi:trigger factor